MTAHNDKDPQRRLVSANRPSDRAFGLVFTALFGLIALIGWRVSGLVPVWAIGASGLLFVVTVLVPGLLLPLNRLWAVASPSSSTTSCWGRFLNSWSCP
jgi:hypothetical protein